MSKSRYFMLEGKGSGKKFGEINFPDHICQGRDSSVCAARGTREKLFNNEKIQSAVAVAYKLLEGRVMLLSSDVLPYQGPECFGAFLFRSYEED
jgi:hypothetical protein